MFTTNPIQLSVLLNDIDTGRIQLPDFQRGWVWEDERIKDLLVSISRSFPVGAIMTLSADGEVQFQKRMIEGTISDDNAAPIERYLLDGQQRMTSLYQALVCTEPVNTRDRAGGNKLAKRWYYLDMQAATQLPEDPEAVIVSIPENRLETRNIGREIVRDLSTPELEFQHHMMPTEQIMRNTAWGFKYAEYWSKSSEAHPHGDAFEFFTNFQEKVLNNFTNYQLPVINLDRNTSKEAVCQVFEKVNTGGVNLSVFELLTASMAAEDFSLRDDWNQRRQRMCSQYGILQSVDNTHFVQALTLLATQERHRKAPTDQIRANAINCKKPAILSLTKEEYLTWADQVEAGFIAAAEFLHEQFIFTQLNLRYSTQLVTLAALHVELNQELRTFNARRRLEQWYWCAIFGEMYAGSTETWYGIDLPEIADYVRHGNQPRLIREANFQPERLISLRSRNSAAYKGLYALQMKNNAADWLTGKKLARDTWREQSVDIHHIFPVNWCEKVAEPPVPKQLYDSIINKTPIDAATNRRIGGRAPSDYLRNLARDNALIEDVLRSHWLEPATLHQNQFAECFLQRGEAMLRLISEAMGKPVTDGRATLLEALQKAGLAGSPTVADEATWLDIDDDNDYDAVGNAAYTETLAADD